MTNTLAMGEPVKIAYPENHSGSSNAVFSVVPTPCPLALWNRRYVQLEKTYSEAKFSGYRGPSPELTGFPREPGGQLYQT